MLKILSDLPVISNAATAPTTESGKMVKIVMGCEYELNCEANTI